MYVVCKEMANVLLGSESDGGSKFTHLLHVCFWNIEFYNQKRTLADFT